MAAVYKAEDPDNQRVVALKVLTAESASQATRLERFRREAMQGARLRHDNIVTLYEFGEADGRPFLALEFVDGVDVEELIREYGPLSPEDARAIVTQVAQALDYAHDMGVVHRDIKPSNIMITRRHGRCIAKLTDLGLARGGIEEESRVTADGSTVGTVDYMPPEQARDSGSADTRSDMYSLGCSLYHMLSGAPPFAEGSIIERLTKHAKAEPADLREINHDVPEELWAICRRMMAKKPAQRYQTPAELLTDLAHTAPHAGALGDPNRATKVGGPTHLAGSPEHARAHGGTLSLAERMARDQGPEPTATPSDEARRVVESQFQHATHAVASGNYDYGMVLLLNCCNVEPGNLLFHQALYQAQHGRLSTPGIKSWRSWPVRLLLKLGLKTAQGLGKPLRVLSYGRQLLTCNPDDLATQLDMAAAARRVGFAELALWLLETVLSIHADHPRAMRSLAELLEERKDIPRALGLWETIARDNPQDHEARRKVRDLSASAATGKYYAARKSKRSSSGNSVIS
jgi:hypothetical protein